jgi:hypothetical protein
MKTGKLFVLAATLALPFGASAKDTPSSESHSVSDEVIIQQQLNLLKNTEGKGFGPQSPRDIDSSDGRNSVLFSAAPAYSQMNVCNIHFHHSAEHKGGEFTQYAGHGDGKGHYTGYKYSGRLTQEELSPLNSEVCSGQHGGLRSGDTIEVHYVYTTAQITPGPTLGACFNEASKNPQLRVEAQVVVLTHDKRAADFVELTQLGKKDGFHQALNIPTSTGIPVQYLGSTTGPGHNEKGSPFQVSWSVRPKVAKVNIESVGKWCKDNVFKEDHGHGVRNLVTNPDLLSPFKR